MPTAIRIRNGVVRHECDERMSQEQREVWIQERGGKGGLNFGRTFAEINGDPALTEGGDRRRWTFMAENQRLLMMASGTWRLTEVKDLMRRFKLAEGGVKNGKIWFEVQDPSAFVKKDTEGNLRLQDNRYYQWLPERKKWIVSLPPEEQSHSWDIHEGQLAVRYTFLLEDAEKARATWRKLKETGRCNLVMLSKEPVIKFVAIPLDQKGSIGRLVSTQMITVIRNGMAMEYPLQMLELDGKAYAYVAGRRKLTLNEKEERWFDGVLVRVPLDNIWNMIIREAPLRKTSDLESCSQCPFWATYETDTGREQRCAKGLLSNSIEALRSLHCDDMVKLKDRGNQFRPFPTWVEATDNWNVLNQREGKLPLWFFSEKGSKRIPHASGTKAVALNLSIWGSNHLNEEAKVLACREETIQWSQAIMSEEDIQELGRRHQTPQEWVAWLSQHGDALPVPYLSPSLFARVVSLANTESLSLLGPAFAHLAMEMSDEEILDILCDYLESHLVSSANLSYEEEEEEVAFETEEPAC